MTRTAATNVRVSWTAPSSGPALGGYEVFYQTAAGSNGSSTTTTTELTLTGLVLGQTYSIIVVAAVLVTVTAVGVPATDERKKQ